MILSSVLSIFGLTVLQPRNKLSDGFRLVSSHLALVLTWSHFVNQPRWKDDELPQLGRVVIRVVEGRCRLDPRLDAVAKVVFDTDQVVKRGLAAWVVEADLPRRCCSSIVICTGQVGVPHPGEHGVGVDVRRVGASITVDRTPHEHRRLVHEVGGGGLLVAGVAEIRYALLPERLQQFRERTARAEMVAVVPTRPLCAAVRRRSPRSLLLLLLLLVGIERSDLLFEELVVECHRLRGLRSHLDVPRPYLAASGPSH